MAQCVVNERGGLKRSETIIRQLIFKLTLAVGDFGSVHISSLPCVSDYVPFFFQNGLVTGSPEMFKLKSCIRRKTDSIDKRFCFDIEVVERFEHQFPPCSFSFFLFLSLNKHNMKKYSICKEDIYVFTSLFHIFIQMHDIYWMYFHCMVFLKRNKRPYAGKKVKTKNLES